MRNFIREHLKYPPQALEQGIEGTVSLKYTIDHNGVVIDTHVIASLGYGCDEEAIRLARLLKFEVPRTRGVKVQFHKNLHVHFRRPKKKIQEKKTMPGFTYVNTPGTKDKAVPQAGGYQYTITITKKEP